MPTESKEYMGKLGSAWENIKSYFNTLPNKADEEETKQRIIESISFRGATLWVLIFAIFIASLGLNVNSTAVIIGAMLISPLMGPITGMGLAVGIGDLSLLQRSLKNFAIMVVISVATATIYFYISPLKDAQSELLARTSPTLYDVLIALCGGAAGILALSTKGSSNVIPGVAIATALMPPLCTAGYGLGTGNLSYFLGAFYLFFINSVYISFSTFIGVKMLRFKRKQFQDAARLRRVNRTITIIVIITLLPSIYFSIMITRQSFIENSLRSFVKNEFPLQGTQFIKESISRKDSTIELVAVGRVIPENIIAEASRVQHHYGLSGYKLRVIQGTASDSLLLAVKQDAKLSLESSHQQIVEQNSRIHSLEEDLKHYTRFEKLSGTVSEEIASLYPTVQSLSLANVTDVRTDTASASHYVLALVNSEKQIKGDEMKRMASWLKARTQADSLRLIVNVPK